MSEEEIQHRVSIYIFSEEESADDISVALGLSCSRQFRKGDRRSGTLLTHKQNVWILDSALEAGVPFNEHIAHLLELLAPYSEKLEALLLSCEAQCTCIANGKSMPELTFDADLLLRLGKIGADLDIDLYIDPADG